MMDVAIIESGGANFASIQAALLRAGATSVVTSDVKVMRAASHVILPGVGSAAYAMQTLRDRRWIDTIRSFTQPVLGICLGHQLLCADSEEGQVTCLGIIPIRVKRITAARVIPHMGWNDIVLQRVSPLLEEQATLNDFYFVHSYAAEISAQYTVASCKYGDSFSAVIQKDNFYGVQFHPEKSGEAGLTLLQKFVRL